MEYLIGFVVGMLATILAIRWMAGRVIDRLLTEVEKQTVEAVDNNKLKVNLEFEQDIYFLYNNEDGSFIAQGNNLVELKQHLQQRFPNRTIAIVNGDPVALKNLGQQIKEFNENSNSVGSTP